MRTCSEVNFDAMEDFFHDIVLAIGLSNGFDQLREIFPMIDYEHCSKKDECESSSWPGRGAFDDPISQAAGGRPWQECWCGITNDNLSIEKRINNWLSGYDNNLNPCTTEAIELLRNVEAELVTAKILLQRALPFVNHIYKLGGVKNLPHSGDLQDDIQEYLNGPKL